MADPSSNHYLPGYDAVAHHELRTAETCAGYLLPTLRTLATANPRLALLDVGAGCGSISISLAAQIPDGHVTALDVSAEILARAATRAAAAGATNMTFRRGDIHALPFPAGAFDVVHAHQVLLYLADPAAGLRELVRVARPGGAGVVAVRNNDMALWAWWPRLPALQRFHDVQLATHAAAGGHNLGGTALLSWALQAGVPRDRIVASHGTWSYGRPEERRVWGTSFAQRARTGALGRKAMEMGLATAAELEEMARAWEAWIEAEDGWFGCLHGELLIRTW